MVLYCEFIFKCNFIMKKIISIFLLFLIAFLFTSCSEPDNNKISNSEDSLTIDENIEPAQRDTSYDKNKVLPLYPNSNDTIKKMEGYIYNKIDIRLYIHSNKEVSNISKSLLGKSSFNNWLSVRTNLVFINKIIDNKTVFTSWSIEFPDATKEEVEGLIKLLKENKEVFSVTYRTTILPEYDTIENRQKKLESMFRISFNEIPETAVL